jgi:gluconokinase
VIVLVMGPAGAGKTTVGEMLAAQLAWDFFDADNFHPAANIEKMAHGIPLGDEDRIPWLDSIQEALLVWDSNGRNAVLACSALKRSYRERLQINSTVKFVYLKGSYELLRGRLHSRKGHYAGEQILAGQFADLEEPTDAVTIDAALPVGQIVAVIRSQLAFT